MSIEKKTFTVALLGVENAETAILQRTFGFTTSLERTRAYEIINGKATQVADILIVNADNPSAMSELKASHMDADGNSRIPIVYAAATRPAHAKYHIRRPWFAARILKTLDEVTVGEMDFIPEFTIDDSAPTNVSSVVSRAQEAVTTAPTPTASALTALVVDDSLPVRKQVEMELKMNGINADLVESGEKALDAIKDKKYDAIFLDVMMPGINGYQTCKAIKADPINRYTPVIMLTGKSSSFDKVKGKFAGCDSYITKPVGRTDFQKIVQQYLSDGFKE
jgi:twitching motility two-component system response regulator PilG